MRRQVRNARVDVMGSVAGSSVAGSSVVGAPQEMAEAIVHGEEHHAAAWAFWRRIGSPRTVLAPMVNQSELAFRMVARHYGAKLCFTPMLHSTDSNTNEGATVARTRSRPRQISRESMDDSPG